MAPSKRFSFKNISARLHGKDVTYEGQLATAREELQEAEEAVSRSQREFELVLTHQLHLSLCTYYCGGPHQLLCMTFAHVAEMMSWLQA